MIDDWKPAIRKGVISITVAAVVAIAGLGAKTYKATLQVQSDLTHLTENVTKLESSVNTLSEKVGSATTTMAEISRDLDNLKDKVEKMEDDVKEVNNRLNTHIERSVQ